MTRTLLSACRRAFSTTLSAIGVAACVAGANAQVNYTSFPNANGLNLVSSAAISSTSHLRLTTNTGSQFGAAWFAVPQSVGQGFSTTFTFSITNLGNGGADGFAFVIQNSSANAIGGNGGGCTLGYDGLPNSVAVEFDTYQTSGTCVGNGNVNDPDDNHISIHTRGTAANSVMESASIGSYSPPVSMKNGNTHTVQIVYVPGSIKVYYDGSSSPVISAPLNLSATLSLTNGLSAWVGFTGATGGSYERHDILTWSFTPTTGVSPLAFGAVNPNPIVAGTSGLLTVGVTPSSILPNTITSVIVDGSSLGLSSALSLNDSGTGGDLAGHDNIWSATITPGFTTPAGPRSLPFTVTDAQNRTATGAVSFTVNAPAPGDDRRPLTPTITEPALEGQVINAADLHMVTANMVSPVGASHLCSDWEIYKIGGGAGGSDVRVWYATCVSIGSLKVHIHLGDGTFDGPYAGRTILEYDTDYYFRVRHRDDSGDPVSEYSYWATRHFHSAPPTQIFSYQEDDLITSPVPTWRVDAGGAVTLPTGASLVLGSAQNDLLLRVDGTPTGNQLTNPPALTGHVDVRVSVNAPAAAALSVGPSTITVVDHDCNKHSIYLPAISLSAGGQVFYWVTSSGSTYAATGAQTTPNFTTLTRGTLSPWELREPGYVVETFATNFQLPVNIAFVPNPGPNPSDIFFYVTELYGQVMVVTRDGTSSVYASSLLNYPPTGVFPGSGECGVAGIVVEPTTGDLFVGMLYAVTTGDPTQLRPKVVRMHSNDGGHTMATMTTLVTFPNEPQGQSHQISNITIGPDAKLYVHMGDGFDQTKGQDLTSARGKVLRLNFDGSSPADNPFYTGANPRSQVWLYGLRNPFGGAWRYSDPSGPKHFTIENGPSNDRISMGVRGQNYLYDGSDPSMNNFNVLAISNNPLVAAWYPAHGPVNGAFIQSSVFNGSGFPPGKMDHLFVTESGPTYGQGAQTLGKRVSEFVLTPDTGTLVSGPAPFIEYTGSGFASCVGIAAGPDGLYFSELYKDLDSAAPNARGASILRIRYVGASGACPSCPADFNGADGLNVQDIFDFLNAWFAGDPRADFNGLQGLNVQDIFDFLNAWFQGC
jgi:glucose/arabinose dehydrogenase